MGMWDDIKEDFSSGMDAAKSAGTGGDSSNCPTCGQSMGTARPGLSLGGGLKSAKAAGQQAKNKMRSDFLNDSLD